MGIFLGIYSAFALLAFVALISLDIRGLVRSRSSADGELRYKKWKEYSPRVLVIIPCKGMEINLYQNLLSIKGQAYPNYDIVAVVDSKSDSSLNAIRQAKIRYLVSDSMCKNCSGKVNAILSAIGKFRNYSAYVIADSDITADPMWLGRLTAPLHDKETGLSTMFPYFKPVGGFWSRMKLLWGFIGEGMMENGATRFGWGGSLAFRRDLINEESLDFIKSSKYSVSDDICLTKIAKGKGLKIAYTKQSQPVVYSDENFSSFAEWSNRQTALSILGYRRNLYAGIFFYSAEVITTASAIALSIMVSPVFLLMLSHMLLSYIKTYKRIRDRSEYIWLIVPVMPAIYLANLLSAYTMKEITWRGKVYRLRH